MNTESSKTSEAHRFKLYLTDKLNLKDPQKNMALANLSIYYTWGIEYLLHMKSEHNSQITAKSCLVLVPYNKTNIPYFFCLILKLFTLDNIIFNSALRR